MFWEACIYWKMFRQLYDAGEIRIELMNKTAPGFFARLKPIWADSLILGVARLFDPARTESRLNLTWRQLHYRLGGEDQALDAEERAFLDWLEHRIGRMDKLATPFMEHRHRRIAHNDFNLRMGIGRRDMTYPPSRRFAGILNVMEWTMNRIRWRYGLPTMVYTRIMAEPGADENALLWSLAKTALWNAENPNAYDAAMKLAKSRYHNAWGD